MIRTRSCRHGCNMFERYHYDVYRAPLSKKYYNYEFYENIAIMAVNMLNNYLSHYSVVMNTRMDDSRILSILNFDNRELLDKLLRTVMKIYSASISQ